MKDKDWIYGLVLGDGYISKPRGGRGTSSLQISHSIRQVEYLQWKADKLHELGFKSTVQPLRYIHDKKSEKSYPVCTLQTQYSKFWAELRAEMYAFRNTPEKMRKRVTKPLIKKWSLNTLLLLYLDNGYNSTDSNRVSLYTYQHLESEQKLLQEWIYDLTGAEMLIKDHKGYQYLYTCRDGEIFRSALRPIFPNIECMKYKMHHHKSEELTDTPIKVGE